MLEIALPLFVGITFLCSSTILYFVQLFIYFVIRPIKPALFRKLNYYLIYSSWSQVVGLAEWYSGSYTRIFADEETWKHFGNEHALVAMNHKYEVDWLVCWMVTDKFGFLASAKSFAKSSLKKLPIIGWSWAISDMIFLERNWEKDVLALPKKLENVLAYEDKCLMLFFAEGTRFTPEKHQASVQYAKEKNLPVFKYHLLPRTKGFNFCVKHLKGKTQAIYDIQLGFPKGVMPNVKETMGGKQMIADMYVRRIPMEQIPVESDEKCSQFLYDLYRHKEQVMEEYWKTGVFPGVCKIPPRRIWGLLNLLFWGSVVGLPLVYYLLKMLLSGSTTVILVASTCIILVLTSLHFMLGATQVNKGSSYGTSTPSPKRSPSTPESLNNLTNHTDSSTKTENHTVNGGTHFN